MTRLVEAEIGEGDGDTEGARSTCMECTSTCRRRGAVLEQRYGIPKQNGLAIQPRAWPCLKKMVL